MPSSLVKVHQQRLKGTVANLRMRVNRGGRDLALHNARIDGV